MEVRSVTTGRWMLAHVAVLAVVVVLVNLGAWQLRRLDERRDANARVEARGRLGLAPVDSLTPDDEFRRAIATGVFDADHEVLVGFRTSDGLPGFHVVTPLLLTTGAERGQAVLVNRGFVPLELADRWPVASAAPPVGEVTVTGLLRRADRAARPPSPPDGKATRTPRTNQVDVEAIDPVVPASLLPVQLELQEPVPEGFPEPLPPLDLGEGPHLSYAFQWFAFATIAAVGWLLFVRRSAQRMARSGHARVASTA